MRCAAETVVDSTLNMVLPMTLRSRSFGSMVWPFSSWARISPAYAVILLAWFALGERMGRTGFYVLFACAVTVSVQLVGLYLVFTTLIVPALATRRMVKGRLVTGYALSAAGYALGLLVSALTDWPSGPAIVWVMTALAVIVFAFTPRASRYR